MKEIGRLLICIFFLLLLSGCDSQKINQLQQEISRLNNIILQKDAQIKQLTEESQLKQDQLDYSEDKLSDEETKLENLKRDLDNVKKELNNTKKQSADNKQELENEVRVLSKAKDEAAIMTKNEITTDRNSLEKAKKELDNIKRQLNDVQSQNKANNKNENIIEGRIKEITPFSDSFSDFLGSVKVDNSVFWIDKNTIFEEANSLDDLITFERVSILYYARGANKIATRIRLLK